MSTKPFTFHNWGGNLSCAPRQYRQPASEAEVCEIVSAARRQHSQVRVVGGGHSWSPLVLTDDILLNLDHLNQLITVDKPRLQVTVGAGIRLKELNELLPSLGMALTNLGSIAEQSIAGASATGTHGTGLHIGNIATQIIGMHLVTADGQVRVLTLDQDPELLNAARVNLGALGIVTQVTLQCVKQHNLHFHGELRPFNAALDDLDRLNQENVRVRYYWFSGTDQLYVMTMNPTDEIEPAISPLTAWFNDVFLRLYVDDVLLKASYAVPALLEPINRFQTAVAFKNEDRVARSDRILLVPMTPVHMQTEYAVPVERTVEAMRLTRKLVEQNHFGANVPVELRFVAGDETMLSPAYGYPVCHVGAYTYGENYALPYFHAFGNAMKALGGRPHWGKWLELTATEARALYPMYDRFNAIRRELDPEGTFANKFIHAIFDETKVTG